MECQCDYTIILENAETVAAIVSALAAVIAAVISVIIYLHTINRERKLYTTQEFFKLRDKYPNLYNATQDKRLQYLKEMERFCTGVNNKVFDIKIIKQMSGHFLVKQYDDYMQELIYSRRNDNENEWKYIEYEKVINKLKRSLKK